MAYNALEYLKQGKIDFIDHLTMYDQKSLVKSVRIAHNRVEIIAGFLDKLKDQLPYFCFNIIYDIPEYSKEAFELFDKKIVSPSMLDNILKNVNYGDKIMDEYLDYFLLKDEDYVYVICNYAFSNKKMELLHKLSRYRFLHIRFLFMEYMINNYKDMIDIIYDDITKYTTSITYEQYEQLTFLPQLMDVKDISTLAILLLNNDRKEDFNRLKEFILKEYKVNYLASKLLVDNKNEFELDADRLFSSSLDYRLAIYLNKSYKKMVSKELFDVLVNTLNNFNLQLYGVVLSNIYYYGLGRKLEEYVQKYLDLSKNKDHEYVGGGSTSSCFRIGDYVFKLVKTKWSYEDVICPDLYLIAKNYEEDYIRDSQGIVRAGLEVQKYLKRKANIVSRKYFELFDQELNRLGYRRTDSLINGSCGDNTMLLDSYKDADTYNPEKLPDWFKKYPLVLVDRDRIYPKDKKYIKQLGSGY